MDDLSDWRQCGVVDSDAVDQYLEGTMVSFVRELRFEHIEADLVGQRFIIFGSNKLEPGIRIDKTPNEPRARHAVHINSLARNPALSFEGVWTSDCNVSSRLARFSLYT